MTRARSRSKRSRTVHDVSACLEKIAPPGLGQSWDNVGLQVGDGAAVVRRVLLCIDLTPAVLREAARRKAGLVIAYHPPIFKPVSRILAGGQGMESVVFECIRRQIALYSTHTALDAADGGTNDVLAALCGVKDAAPIEWVDEPGVSEVKLVVFVPQASLERVADAIFEAGAGHIGDYSRCSYRLSGQGTFFGGDSTNPTIGERGRMEFVDEVRLESVVDAKKLPAAIRAMIEGHPYEEPAYDIYPLTPKPVRGIGRVGALARSTTLGKLARKLKRATAACCVQIVGPAERVVERAVVCAGAAGSIPFQVPLGERDVIVTGEIRHHDALMIERCGCCAVALGHWASERPVLKPLAERLGGMVSGVDFVLSEADREPFGPV